MKMILLLIQCFLLLSAECVSHSLQFLSTGRVQPGDHPHFEQLTVFNGVPISYCDSFTKREEFKPSLETKNLPEHCDEASTNTLDSLYEIPRFLNNTLYIVQRRRGCIVSVNGDVSAFEAWAVNGMDFMSFDPESQTWTSQSPSAVTLKHLWNNNSPRNFVFRHFIRERCPEMIQRIKLRSKYQKTELRVFAKPTVNTDQALLRCHVTSTDKSLSSVHLIGDGASKASWITITGPVPSEDGCVILRLTAGISLRQNTNKYGCAVQTGGHNFTVYWDGNTLDGRRLNILSDRWTILIVIFVAICCIFAITIVLGFVFKSGENRIFRQLSPVDPQLIQMVTSIVESRETAQRSEEENFFDPEFFARAPKQER